MASAWAPLENYHKMTILLSEHFGHNPKKNCSGIDEGDKLNSQLLSSLKINSIFVCNSSRNADLETRSEILSIDDSQHDSLVHSISLSPNSVLGYKFHTPLIQTVCFKIKFNIKFKCVDNYYLSFSQQK